MVTQPDIVIMAGGGGTRLWPWSRQDQPKQFLRIPHDKTLLEQAVRRARLLVPYDHIWIVTIAAQVAATKKVLRKFPGVRIISEPIGRNSGPAAALATLVIEKLRGAAVTVLIAPADHWIEGDNAYRTAMRAGLGRAAEGRSLITFGLPVASPRTDFGYLEVQKGRSPMRVLRFVEKPPLAAAKRFARSGRHFWNSGIFAWRSDLFHYEMMRHAPRILGPLRKALSNPRALARAYKSLPDLSIDYALMEKSQGVETVPARFRWSDLGNWQSLYEALAEKPGANVLRGAAVAVEGRGNLAQTDRPRIVLFDVNDLVVVASGDTVLVTRRTSTANLKGLLQSLR